ncbi:MAG: hypothetical protein RL653_2486 [Pseudomonadota bacterium]|jgi:hypothetical protein
MNHSGVVRLAGKLSFGVASVLLLTAGRGPWKQVDGYMSCYQDYLAGKYCSYGETGLDVFEAEIEKEKGTDTKQDPAEYLAVLKAARAKAKEERMARSVDSASSQLTYFVDKLNPNDCVTLPGGCARLKESLKEADVAGMRQWADANLNHPQNGRTAKRVLQNLEEAKPSLKQAADRFYTSADEHFSRVKTFRATSLLLTDNGCREVLVIVEGGLSLSPGHEKLSKLEKTARALLADIEKQRDATVYSSPFHRENAEKVRVSTEYQEPKEEDAAAFKSAVKAGEPLFGNAYFKAPIGELTMSLGVTANVSVLLKEDDKEVAGGAWVVEPSDAEFKQGFTTFEIFPLDPKEPSSLYLANNLVKGLASLDPGKHTLTVKVNVHTEDASSGSTGATGTFEYDNSTGNEKVEAASRILADLVLDASRMPSPEMKDAGLEKQVVATVSKNDFGDKALRAVITDGEFTYTRNDLTGILISRSFRASVAVKRKDGRCEVRNYPVEQQALAGGKKFAPATAGFHTGEYAIRCENINKK